MSIDHPEATATTSRRSFLTRTALGGAVLTAGALAGPLDGLVRPAGAEARHGDGMDNEAFATFAVPLEMAAVQAYQAAFSAEIFSTSDARQLLAFQANHQAVVDTLSPLLAEDAAAPVPDADIQKSVTATITSSSAPEAVLTSLADLETTLASTHLNAIAELTDTSMAKTVAQVLATESAQSALLGVNGGGSIEDATPTLITTDEAIMPEDHADN